MGLPEPQQSSYLVGSRSKNASALLYNSQENSNTCIHCCSSIIDPTTLVGGVLLDYRSLLRLGPPTAGSDYLHTYSLMASVVSRSQRNTIEPSAQALLRRILGGAKVNWSLSRDLDNGAQNCGQTIPFTPVDQ